MQIYKQLLLEYIELSLIPYIVYSPAILIMPVIDRVRVCPTGAAIHAELEVYIYIGQIYNIGYTS